MRPDPSTSPSSGPDLPDGLTPRQGECLRLAAEGLTSHAIGVRLGLSPRTVDEHLMSACEALGVRTRIQAVARLAGRERSAEARSFLP